mmetsp:Transcript_31649/g.73889  ORF Transcript_31649/g.73889 Transcript_31649/m.73889 type:complete len:462 (-) Transcript_31649:147-1532(-)
MAHMHCASQGSCPKPQLVNGARPMPEGLATTSSAASFLVRRGGPTEKRGSAAEVITARASSKNLGSAGVPSASQLAWLAPKQLQVGDTLPRQSLTLQGIGTDTQLTTSQQRVRLPVRSPEVSTRQTAPAILYRNSVGQFESHVPQGSCNGAMQYRGAAPPPLSSSGAFLPKAANTDVPLGTSLSASRSCEAQSFPAGAGGVPLDAHPVEALPPSGISTGGGACRVKQAAFATAAGARAPARSMVPSRASRFPQSFAPAPRFFSYTPSVTHLETTSSTSSKVNSVGGVRFLDGIQRPSAARLLGHAPRAGPEESQEEGGGYDGALDPTTLQEAIANLTPPLQRYVAKQDAVPTVQTSMVPPVTRYVVGQDGCVEKTEDEAKPAVVPAIAAAAMAAVHAANGWNGLFPPRNGRKLAEEEIAFCHDLKRTSVSTPEECSAAVEEDLELYRPIPCTETGNPVGAQ